MMSDNYNPLECKLLEKVKKLEQQLADSKAECDRLKAAAQQFIDSPTSKAAKRVLMNSIK